MKQNLRNAVIAASIACTALTVQAQTSKGRTAQIVSNSLMKQSTLPFNAPDFSRIKENDYLPAIRAAIAEQRAEIKKITDNKQKPTFVNTILAYERSGKNLERISNIYYALVSADKTPAIEKAQGEIVPLMTDFENEIKFNQKFFQRVKYVYDHEYTKLTGEDKKLLEVVYKSFTHAGALLPKEKMARMQEINKELAKLQQEFGDMLPKAGNEATVWVNDVKELSGLSEAGIAQCKKDAESRGGKAPYCIVITNTTQQPILASLDNRQLRERVYNASIHRTDGTGAYNTFPIIVKIARLRAEKAQLMGKKNYASYSLENTMAKNTDNVYAFLRQLIAAYKPKAEAQTKSIEEYARKTEGNDFHLQPYDRFYYSAKMKKDQYSFSDDEVKPYFNLDSVLVNGIFYAAHRVYGLNFRERKDIPTYNKDMKVFDVLDADGKQLALFYCDYFRRPTKRGGAWMSAFLKQSLDRNQKPLIYNVCNFAKAPEGQPTLLTWDETQTMFHEFGHALHGMLSHCKYNTLSGTAVSRDFVEMPSQFNESFASIPEVFNHYARHYKTNEPMPDALREKMLGSLNFLSAYALGENLAATCLDMAWHCLSSSEVPTAEQASAFEKKVLSEIGLLDSQIPPRYSTSYFNHIWGGGYAAGYYSYLWSEVLAVNIADYFETHGALTRKVGDDFRQKILSRGNTRDLMEIFSDFTGLKAPDTKGLLKARGM
ncbi:MAG: M3 family metallopeptidase [Prevotella histicola]|jgi:putative peptidyl-dipeptidase dcp|uniref:M3 family metallopeptidase n=1 Tax=Prevotella histicola TaxID=470565 RepID=UPI001CB2FB7D|nr:M3 family metallopeptidase [Prevotella histicola]MBF1392951.1 M3 family metallopeptidase [Prevotella histicola]MBF1395249.1 M3 family metallopeptidase [Prevotella histicola]MBF1412158.1 M3 family metallopeptidase [Prevotella histicola]